MNEEIRKHVADLSPGMCISGTLFDLAGKLAEKADIEKRMSGADFWTDQAKAQEVVGRLKAVNRLLEPLTALDKAVEEVKLLVEMVAETGDAELEKELEAKAAAAESAYAKFELEQMMSGPDDGRNVFFSIQAGAGGTESCDWAEMLMRMYTRWFEHHGFEAGMIDTVLNEGAGIKSVTLDVRGPMAYGYLKSEIGVHRLVRISPFDANKRRHTSFASVDVIPQPDEEGEITVKDEDIELEFFHAGGAGGQHVNKTASAVRVRHIPSGLVVACMQERSQHKNRKMALKLLTARLRRIEEDKRNAEIARTYGEKGEIAFGNQIRSYVLQPYQMVKDHRTDVQTGDVEKVLNGGGLDPFMMAYLRSKLGK